MADEPFTLSSEPPPAKRERVTHEPVELLIEHPFADRNWVLTRELEPRWFLLCTTESQFRIWALPHLKFGKQAVHRFLSQWSASTYLQLTA